MIRLLLVVLLFSPSLMAQERESYKLQDKELKLMFRSFLYVKDLESAYKTAQIGYKYNPKSYYWNQKMAEISRWTGRGTQALKYMMFIYNNNYSTKLQNDIIEYGLASYQYEQIDELVVDKARRDPTETNIDNMISIYSKIGEPRKSAEILLKEYKKQPKRDIYLTKALQIYLDMGDLSQASKLVTLMKKKKLYSSKNAELMAYYYYLSQDIQSAYDILILADKSNLSVQYYELLSDIGWYLQKQKQAGEASVELYKIKKARLVDYERISLTQKEKNLSLVSDTSVEAYQQYGVSYIFLGYADYALKVKQYDQLQAKITTLDAKNSPILKEAQYWIIKARLYAHYKEKKYAIKALQKALSLDANNKQIELSILYLYIEYELNEELKLKLDALSERKELPSYFYFTMASSYFYLQDIDRAAYFMDRAREEGTDTVNSLDFISLEAFIAQARDQEALFLLKMRKKRESLELQAKNNPLLLKESDFLNSYLNCIIYLVDTDEFMEQLQKARKYLKEEDYKRLKYSFASKIGADEKSNIIYNSIGKKELWMRLSHAMLEYQHSDLQDLLEQYQKFLPQNDATFIAANDGQTALAQTLAFNALMHNNSAKNSFINHRDLTRKRTDLLQVQPLYLFRDPLKQEGIGLKNRTYIKRGFYLHTNFSYFNNYSLDENLLHNVPKNILKAGVGISREFQRGLVKLNINYHDAMDNYLSYDLKGIYRVNSNFLSTFKVAHDIDIDESIQLLLGGKKDMLELSVLENILSSTSLEYLYRHSKYSSQDDIFLGSGDYARVILAHQLRVGYPDMRISTFGDIGTYDETKGTRGNIDKLQKQKMDALPQDFYNLGFNFAYGMQNRNLYTNIWRPYFGVSSYYNSYSESLNFGGELGVGGELSSQDHLVLGSSYSQSINGVDGNIFKLFLKYEFLYTK
ncbi:MAG: tetratricopeptide repeat protein [Sulfurimonas sp.]|nr:tetratricopeptide repeat protein [Sulfurimonas sp.]